MSIRILIFFIVIAGNVGLMAQEEDLTGIEISIDQDHLADIMRSEPYDDRNYTIGMRIGIYGYNANSPYLGLPFVRERVDAFIVDLLLDRTDFRIDNVSHNFVFTTNGFSPLFVSDLGEAYQEATDLGYSFSGDRPFSSFTGFRSTRRIEGSKFVAHAAGRLDLAITTSFTFGFASFGLAHSLDDLFGANRPDPILWDEDETKPFPTGQISPSFMPMIMYSLSAEAVVWRPMKKLVLQVRPEMNLGYYTNLGIGIDFGKVMNVERHVDNISYTDTNNPSTLAINDEDVSFSLVGGITARASFYNAHLKGLFSSNKDAYTSLQNTKTFYYEAYLGAKVQFVQRLEMSFALNMRSAEIGDAFNDLPIWGTVGMKYLIGSAGEGCYN